MTAMVTVRRKQPGSRYNLGVFSIWFISNRIQTRGNFEDLTESPPRFAPARPVITNPRLASPRHNQSPPRFLAPNPRPVSVSVQERCTENV